MEKKLASLLYTSLHTDRYAMCVLTQLTMRAMNKLEGNGLELICNLIGRYHNGLHRLVDALLVPLAATCFCVCPFGGGLFLRVSSYHMSSISNLSYSQTRNMHFVMSSVSLLIDHLSAIMVRCLFTEFCYANFQIR